MLRSRYGVQDRLATTLSDPRNEQACPTSSDIDVQLDRCDDRFVPLINEIKKDLKDGSARLGIPAGEDTHERVVLNCCCPGVEDHGSFAFALMNSSRPTKYEHAPQPV